jgi:hypothetical protein
MRDLSNMYCFKFQARIPNERLRIALEPECAAVYVLTKELPALDMVAQQKKAMTQGSCHLIIDLGGKNFQQFCKISVSVFVKVN